MPDAHRDLYAGFWRRAGASIIDFWVVMIPAALLGATFGRFGSPISLSLTTLVQLFSIVGTWLYAALMESSARQATLGKTAVGIKVTDASGHRLGFGLATGRHFAKMLSGLTFGVGYLMVAFTRRRQGLHDLVAGTLVVRAIAVPTMPAEQPRPASMPRWAVALGVAGSMVIPIGILAAIAIPAYQDYAVRAQVTDGMNAADTHRAAVAEALALDVPPDVLSSESLQLPVTSASRYVESTDVVEGVVVVTYGGAANTAIAGKKLLLVPGMTEEPAVVWACGYAPTPEGARLVLAAHVQYTTIPRKYLPADCRG